MAKKTISAMAEKLSDNDVRPSESATKYICEFQENHFMLPVLEDDGKTIAYHVDPNSNRKLADYKEFHFTKVIAKNKEGKLDPTKYFCFFITSPEIHGKDFDRIKKLLDKKCENPMYRMYKEDDHFKKRNPEAYQIAKERLEIETENATLKNKVEELERRLGVQKRQ
jgi:hypothetical protein